MIAAPVPVGVARDPMVVSIQRILIAKSARSREDYSVLASSPGVNARTGMALKALLLRGWAIESSSAGAPEASVFFAHEGHLVAGHHYASELVDATGRRISVTHFALLAEAQAPEDTSPGVLFAALPHRLDLGNLQTELPALDIAPEPARVGSAALEPPVARAVLHLVAALVANRRCVVVPGVLRKPREVYLAAIELLPHPGQWRTSYLEANTLIESSAPFDVVAGPLSSTGDREIVDGGAVPESLLRSERMQDLLDRLRVDAPERVQQLIAAADHRQGREASALLSTAVDDATAPAPDRSEDAITPPEMGAAQILPPTELVIRDPSLEAALHTMLDALCEGRPSVGSAIARWCHDHERSGSNPRPRRTVTRRATFRSTSREGVSVPLFASIAPADPSRVSVPPGSTRWRAALIWAACIACFLGGYIAKSTGARKIFGGPSAGLETDAAPIATIAASSPPPAVPLPPQPQVIVPSTSPAAASSSAARRASPAPRLAGARKPTQQDPPHPPAATAPVVPAGDPRARPEGASPSGVSSASRVSPTASSRAQSPPSSSDERTKPAR